MKRATLIGILGLLWSAPLLADDSAALNLQLRHRVETAPDSGRYHALVRDESWNPDQTAVIVCDVWDLHHCLNAVRREEEFAPRLNNVLKKLREQGVTVIHAPSGCMEAYADHPARARAMNAPAVADLPDEIEAWCNRIPAEERGTYPIDQSDGGEDDDPEEHAQWAAKLTAMGRNPKAPWKSQSELIEIDSEQDYISDQGDEVWNILAARGIDNVILTGVHTNMCVLGRPFGLRQMSKNGKNVVLMRDMTDTMYNPQRWPYVSHFTGTDLIVEHIEKYVCPTITSDQVLGGEPFVFANDKRPHIAVVMAEDEYETEKTLPPFVTQALGKDFRISFVFGSEGERDDIPGLDVVDDADVLLVSIRRRPLPPEQLEVFRRFVASGKPVVGIRTASHPFHLRNQDPPEGLADWPEWDKEVFGGNYNNHYGNQLQNHVQIIAEQKDHPILSGVRTDEFAVGGSLYVPSPLAVGATALMTGKVEGKDPEPVAWTFTRTDGGRSFYTSLGYKTDFASNPDFQRLLRNGIYWAAGLEIPEEAPLMTAIERYRRHWMPMSVPGTWDEGSGGVLADYEGPAWYRCVVRIPESWQQDSNLVAIRLANGSRDVYLNGRKLPDCWDASYSESYARPTEVDWGEANLIAVRVASFQTMQQSVENGPSVLVYDPDVSVVHKLSLAGTWQFRIDDDPAYATLPLPAKFAASTDSYFE